MTVFLGLFPYSTAVSISITIFAVVAKIKYWHVLLLGPLSLQYCCHTDTDWDSSAVGKETQEVSHTDTDLDGSAVGKETQDSHTDTDLDGSAAGKETREVSHAGIWS